MCNNDECGLGAVDHAGRPFNTGRPATSRRSFLRTGGLIGAGAAVATGLGLPAAVPAIAAPAASWKPDTTSPRFTIAVMPDTQYLFDGASIHPEPLQASLQWLLDHQAEHNIVFLAHLGDLTQNGQTQEFAAIGKAFTVLDKAQAAYSVLAGNHDIDGSKYDDQRGASPYLSTFGPSRFAGSPSYRGSTPDGYNSYHLIRAAGRQWLVFALDWRTSDANLAWVEKTLKRFPTAAAVVTTHDIVGSYDDGTAGFDEYGQHLWDQLISRNDQVFLTLNGHYWPPARTTMQNGAGHDVHLHITNYQNRYYGGGAMLRLYHVDTERNTIDVETVSPWVLGQAPADRNELEAQEIELTGDVDRFSIDIDFAARFEGFAPVTPRSARPARTMIVPGTVAYWRFDGGADGVALGAGTRVRDLTGHGNDLVVADRSGAPANSITWTADHHPDQPAHGSLLLGGGRDTGRYLRTVPKAPMNTATFPRAYTVEAFFKLPADFDGGPDGWAGILGRWGTPGEAGLTNGDLDETIGTLNISGSRELQWAVCPVGIDGTVTNWGHELPTDRWWHVGVVNDGKHTTMYVDGCPVVRNPSTVNHGLITIGREWLVGAVDYGRRINQIWRGGIGDIRVVEAALTPAQFMNA